MNNRAFRIVVDGGDGGVGKSEDVVALSLARSLTRRDGARLAGQGASGEVRASQVGLSAAGPTAGTRADFNPTYY